MAESLQEKSKCSFILEIKESRMLMLRAWDLFIFTCRPEMLPNSTRRCLMLGREISDEVIKRRRSPANKVQ